MAAGGNIFALDVGVRLGVAVGPPNEKPRVFSVRLKKSGQAPQMAGANLIAFLAAEWSKERPALLFKEAPPALAGFARMSNSEATVRLTYALHGIAEAMAGRYGIPVAEKAVSSIRKHYLGFSGRGERSATKRAVIQRGRLLQYLPDGCDDDNMADAIAAWSYACCYHAHVPPKELHFFDEVA
jgi:hypothetical protein